MPMRTARKVQSYAFGTTGLIIAAIAALDKYSGSWQSNGGCSVKSTLVGQCFTDKHDKRIEKQETLDKRPYRFSFLIQ